LPVVVQGHLLQPVKLPAAHEVVEGELQGRPGDADRAEKPFLSRFDLAHVLPVDGDLGRKPRIDEVIRRLVHPVTSAGVEPSSLVSQLPQIVVPHLDRNFEALGRIEEPGAILLVVLRRCSAATGR